MSHCILVEKPTRTWEEWVDTNVELSLHNYKHLRWNNGNPLPWVLETYDTPSALAPIEAEAREDYDDAVEHYKEHGVSVPPTATAPPHYPKTQAELDNPHYLDIYEGPQEVGSILSEFDHRYGRTFSAESAVEIESVYPKEAWIQAFLDKGGSFRDIYDSVSAVGKKK